MVLILIQRPLGCLDNVRRRVEVRVPAPQRDHVLQPRGNLQHPRAEGNVFFDDALC